MPFSCAIFDLDGTLVDSTHAHAGAWQRAFNHYGLRFPVEKYYGDIGMGSRDIVKKHIPNADDSQIDYLLTTQREIFLKDLLPSIKPYPSAAMLLQDLHRRGARIALASSSSRDLIGRLVPLLEAPGTVLGWVGGDEVEHGKPAPDIFLAACRICNVPPDDAIVVGDSPYDVEAAHRGGLPCIALLQSGFTKESLKDADYLFPDLTHLLPHTPEIWGQRPQL